MNTKISISKSNLKSVCLKYHIAKLSLFGSVLREDFTDSSDIDVLVEFEPGHIPGFIKLHQIEQDLSTVFEGRKIDLVTEKSLNKRIRDIIINSAEVQYA